MATRDSKPTIVPAPSVPAPAAAPDLIELLATLKQGDSLAAEGQRLGKMKTAARFLLVVAAVLLVGAIALAVGSNVVGPEHVGWVSSAARLASALSVVISVIAVAIEMVVMAVQAFLTLRRAPQLMRAEFDHDRSHVRQLEQFEAGVLDDADHWLELKQKRMQRRLVRFFGGSDKIAFVVVIAAAWGSWKDLAPLVNGASPSLATFIAAFVAGLVIGGMAVARRLDQIAFQCDLIEMARRALAKP